MRPMPSAVLRCQMRAALSGLRQTLGAGATYGPALAWVPVRDARQGGDVDAWIVVGRQGVDVVLGLLGEDFEK